MFEGRSDSGGVSSIGWEDEVSAAHIVQLGFHTDTQKRRGKLKRGHIPTRVWLHFQVLLRKIPVVFGRKTISSPVLLRPREKYARQCSKFMVLLLRGSTKVYRYEVCT